MSDEFEAVGAEEAGLVTPALAYVRAVQKADLPDAPEQLPDGTLYALHDENGRPLAIFEDRATAIVVARSNALTPMSVH